MVTLIGCIRLPRSFLDCCRAGRATRQQQLRRLLVRGSSGACSRAILIHGKEGWFGSRNATALVLYDYFLHTAVVHTRNRKTSVYALVLPALAGAGAAALAIFLQRRRNHNSWRTKTPTFEKSFWRRKIRHIGWIILQ